MWTNEIHFELEHLSDLRKSFIGIPGPDAVVVFEPPDGYTGEPTCCSNPDFHETKEIVMRMRQNKGEDKKDNSWESHGCPCSDELDWKPSGLVLTVSCKLQRSGHCAITCTNMGGSQVALLEMEEQQTIATLRSKVAAQLRFRGHLRLVRCDGALLNDTDASVAECLL
eukprot:gnl/TRDRNA2_/TRDRNA2_174472_c5_seq6.p1 gnl/TRDRNA2_/TRDRNA2_174472_c5~~gnl/TRDRNA2_/TRDRNA2_174472_c5_seq6.p1  ORF type:complete len:168 (+),score=22.39 gnl/TRDRNA2_/TRDRNA2_174472_c5_seq6:167-670(+)